MKQSEKLKQQHEQENKYAWRLYLIFAVTLIAIGYGILIYHTLNL